MNNSARTLSKVLILIAAVAIYWLGGTRLAAQATTLADTQLDGFRYTIFTANDDSAYVQVQFDLTTADGINGYKRGASAVSNLYAASHLNQPVRVDLTFNHPISLEEFESFSGKYGLDPQDFGIRVMAGNERWTISGLAEKGVIDREAVQRQLTSIEATTKSAEFLGVVYAHAEVPGNLYRKLAADPSVFLADAVQPYLIEQAVALKPSVAEAVDYYCPNVYWAMENLGLVVK
ncbi:MAG TPA: hypothetical protein VF914_14575 [Chloroflexia bacterium]|jgi:hypothetical protein